MYVGNIFPMRAGEVAGTDCVHGVRSLLLHRGQRGRTTGSHVASESAREFAPTLHRARCDSHGSVLCAAVRVTMWRARVQLMSFEFERTSQIQIHSHMIDECPKEG